MSPNDPLVQQLCIEMIARRVTRDPIEVLRRSAEGRCPIDVVRALLQGLFQIKHYDEIERFLKNRLATLDVSDHASSTLLFESYVRLLQQTERYREGLALAAAARKQGIPIEADEYVGICLSAKGKHKEATQHFRAVPGGRLSIRGRTFFVRSLLEIGDFAGVAAESSKLHTVTGYEFSAYANMYFDNWREAAGNLLELARLYPGSLRPHLNIAARDPPSYSPTSIDKLLAPDSALFDRANFLGQRLIHIGQGAQSLRMYSAALRAQQRMKVSSLKPSVLLERTLAQFGIDLSEIRSFGPEWSAQIGHLGMVDLALKMREMGWWSGTPIFLCRPDRIANKLLFRLLTDDWRVLYEGDEIAPSVWASLISLQRVASFPFNVFEDKQRRVVSWNEAGALLTRAWTGTAPLQASFDAWLLRSDEFQADVSTMRRDFRLDDKGWHVCLHVRDDGFYRDSSQSHRNASIAAYLDVVELVRDQGGTVVRMGAPSSPCAPKVPGLVDYAHSRWKSEEMDLYLMRTARCFIGSVSGLSNLAVSLDLPSAFVNSISYDAQMWHSKARFIPKSIFTADGKPLSQREISSHEWRWHLFGADSMAEAGLRSEDNSPDEIREIVVELLQDCKSMSFDTKPEITRQWEKTLAIPHYYGAAQPSAYYLEKHRRDFLRL